jgi:hypothetical protein
LGKSKTATGVLDIYEQTFKVENLTWYKDLACTLSNWSLLNWTDEQIHYVLMDVFCFPKSSSKSSKTTGAILDKLAKTFLLCFEDTAVQARTRQKNTNRSAKSRISNEPTSAHLPPPKVKSSSFKPWQYEDSDSDDDLVIMHRGPAQGLKPTSPEGINVEFEIDSKGIIV